MDREASTQQWYLDYYTKVGTDRNDLRTNRGVLFQTLASEASLVRASQAILHDPSTATVLDVGCGGAGDLYQFLRLKYDPKNITGIDIQPNRIAIARKIYPQIRFIHGNASNMEFEDNTFDLVFESTMFATLPDDELRSDIANEMVRVCKCNGYLLLIDWRTPKPGDSNYKALTKRCMKELFSVGKKTRLIGIYKGALIPPVGRFLSKYFCSMYFLVASLIPILVGQVAFLLQKKSD